MQNRIAIAGKAGSGKSTFADFLVEQYGFKKLSIADPIKKIVYHMAPARGRDVNNKAEMREPMQLVGEGGRLIDKTFWIAPMIKKHNLFIGDESIVEDRIVIDDMRFIDEADYLKSLCGFTIIRIDVERDICKQRLIDSYGSCPDEVFEHSTEMEIDQINADHVLTNEGIRDLELNYDKLEEIINS